MKVEIVTHYDKDDKECSGEYVGVDVIVEGKVVASYQDYYHDKGDLKAEAFVEGLKWALKKEIKVKKISVSDYDV